MERRQGTTKVLQAIRVLQNYYSVSAAESQHARVTVRPQSELDGQEEWLTLPGGPPGAPVPFPGPPV